MELHGGPRQRLVDHALVGVIIGVAEQCLPAVGEGGRVHREPVTSRVMLCVVFRGRKQGVSDQAMIEWFNHIL